MLKMRLFTAPDVDKVNLLSKSINVKYATQSTLNGVETVEMIAQKSDETILGNILH
jgi:hypothetical protein